MKTDERFALYEQQRARAEALEAEILPRNKAALFTALQAAGIATVTIEFEGSGDSGQCEPAVARDTQKTAVALPGMTLTLETAEFSTGEITRSPTTVAGFIETLAYGLLQDTHAGWENNDGGYGQFQFNTAERSIRLEYWERYTETNYHEHEL